jgi:hypothetical protein
MLMERKKYLNSFNRKVAIRKGGRYILWNGTFCEERNEICEHENVNFLIKKVMEWKSHGFDYCHLNYMLHKADHTPTNLGKILRLIFICDLHGLWDTDCNKDKIKLNTLPKWFMWIGKTNKPMKIYAWTWGIIKQLVDISFWIIMNLPIIWWQWKKSLEIWYAWLVANFIYSKEIKLTNKYECHNKTLLIQPKFTIKL